MIKRYKNLISFSQIEKMSARLTQMVNAMGTISLNTRSERSEGGEFNFQNLAFGMLISIAIIALAFPSGDVYAQTLDDYLNEAVENNPNLKASYATFEASLQRVAEVNALPDPTLSFGYFVSPIETRLGAQRAKISLIQMFPWFGTLKAKEDAVSLMADACYQEFLDNKNKLFLAVKKAYYPILEIKEHIHWQKENLSILKFNKQLSTTSFSNGKGSMTDVIRVDILAENVAMDIILLNDKIKPYMVEFNRLLNRGDTALVLVVDTLNLSNVVNSDRNDSVIRSNPLLQAMELKLKVASANEVIARKQGMPKLGIGIDYVIITERSDISIADNGKDAFMPMVTISLPIFRGKYKASIKEAQFLQTAISYKKEGMENTLISSYERALYEIKKSRQLTGLYQRQTEKTEQMLTLLYKGYSNSGKDFEELLRMQQQLFKYKQAIATAKKDYYLTLAQLDYITAKSN